MPLSLESLERFENATLELQSFAGLVPGAADHVTLRWGKHVSVSGAVGGVLLMGIFHRMRKGEYPHELVSAFEERLSSVLRCKLCPASSIEDVDDEVA